jgi:probable phosphoglycerate mutase
MFQLVLIRPGCTDYDQQGRIQGTLDIPLNEEGIQYVDRLSQELRDLNLEAIYCSESEPSHSTADRLGEALHVRVKSLSNMQNLNLGLWQGMLIDEVRVKQPKVYKQWQEQPFCICPPEGEMLSAAAERVQAAMNRLLRKHKSGVIGLVVPEPLASLVRVFFTQTEPRNLWRACLEGVSWEIIEVQPQEAAQSR